MRVRFRADADLDARIVRGLKRRQPGIDIRTAAEAGLGGLEDAAVLRIAAVSTRVLVTHDKRTMPGHFAEFLTANTSPGVIVAPRSLPMATLIDELLLLWAGSDATEWENRLVWLPL